MTTKRGVTPSQLAGDLAELSRLDLTCNLKDWKRAVVSAVRTEPGGAAWVPRDWAHEVHIALNCLLDLCVRERHGQAVAAIVRRICRDQFLAQAAAGGAAADAVTRLGALQIQRFDALGRVTRGRDWNDVEARALDLLVAGVVGPEAATGAGARELRGRFADFHAAMRRAVEPIRLARDHRSL
jgi:hypothetical protein